MLVSGPFQSANVLCRHQLLLKWARFGPDEEIALTEDFSNLTLDTLALCTMDFRFNSFYRDGTHPFVTAMNTSLFGASGSKSQIPLVNSALSLIGAGKKGVDPEVLQNANEFMTKTGQEIIEHRRSNPVKKNDFLNMMMYGKDPKTGQVMRDELIRAQMPSILTAGHETTSGMLSFAVIFLLQNPETYRRAQEEVDRVVGSNSMTVEHLRDLKYLYAVLQETLRLVPTAPVISKVPHPKLNHGVCTLGGKYKIEPTDRIRIMLGKSMSDPKAFGEDARDFKPERMLEDSPGYENLAKYWKPFSEGSRGCLGRPFSLQEAMLGLALILQNFDLRLADPMYKMRIKHAFTIKPLGLYVKASLRHGMTPLELEGRLHHGEQNSTKPKNKASSIDQDTIDTAQDGAPLTILYGSNTGTCQALAQRLASEAASTYGFSPKTLDMDAAVGRLSKTHPTIIVTSSYEGEPPDNALQFVQHLEGLKDQELDGVKFAVFGCGHKDWHSTFHRIPNLVNDTMKARGAQQIANIGLSDVSRGNPMADFETYLDDTLLPELKRLSPSSKTASEPTSPDVEADISTGERVATLHQDLQVGTVKEVETLTAPGEQPEKRHMEVELPPESTYECGDYLAVLPQSPEANVRAVMSHFKLPNDATITLKSKIFSPLPLNTSLSVSDLLRNYYELAKPATRRGLSLALKHTADDSVRKQISRWLEDEDSFRSEITDAHISLLDLLIKHSQIEIPLPAFLSLLPPLSIRQYSISSSPLKNPETCTITYSVVTDEKNSDRPFYGVATTYLSTLKPGDRIQVATRRTAKQTFRLPLDAESTPILMFAAGTGLAPFRGFIEQRAVQLEANPKTKLAPAHLFLGCRSSKGDRLYADQMDKWASVGAVELYYSFSQEPERSEGCKHVADRMLKEEEIISSAWVSGARAYTCGNRSFAQSVDKASRSIVENRLQTRKDKDGWTKERVEQRKTAIFASLSERAADDVFD